MQTLSSLSDHTARFYEWEISGRGWHEYEHLVQLEPHFRPFFGYGPASRFGSRDDGRRHTFFSALLERFTRSSPRVESLEEERAEPEPPLEVEVPDELMEETEVLIPTDYKIDSAVTLSFLRSISQATGPIAFELVGRGGRVSVRFASSAVDTPLVRTQLGGFIPTATLVTPATDLVQLWRHTEGEELRVVEFGLAREFVVPLVETAKTPDPLIPFIAALSRADELDLAVVQILFAPVKAPWGESAFAAVRSPDGEPFLVDAPEVTKQAEDKLSSPLYAVRARLLVKAHDSMRADEILRGIAGAVAQYGSPKTNALIALDTASTAEDAQYNILLRCTNRPGMLLSLKELASIVKMPGADVRTPALLREIEISTRLPDEVVTDAGVVLGLAEHEGAMVSVRLPPDVRMQHTYVIGASGTGKSTLLEQLILQDIAAGHGVGVLDPHGDLVDEILARIPDDRIEDVVLFDPSEPDWVVGWNILAANSEVEKILLASDLVAVFQRLSTSWGDQMSTVLGNAVLTFLESKAGGTLVDLRKFLLDDSFRKAFIATVSDEHGRSFWREEFPLLIGKKPQAPILTRLNSFLRLRLVREAVVERDRPLNFREIIDQKKIFLARLPQGAIGEENSALLGSLIVSKFHQVALSRQDTAAESRTPFFLFVDEFQDVATPSMAGLFSGVRKYKLALCVAHQDMYQLHATAPELERSILGNAYTRVVFRVSEEDGRKLERGMGQYTVEDLGQLGRGEAICRVGKSNDAFRLLTVPLDVLPKGQAQQRRQLVKSVSYARYGRKRVAPPETDVASNELHFEPTSAAASSEESMPPGRGGRQHKYIQSLLKRVGVERGFDVATELAVLDGHGHVDVALEKNGLRIGCEIAVSTSVSHELNNLSKCLAAGFNYAALVSSEEGTLRNAERRFVSELSEVQRGRVRFLTPDGFIGWLENVQSEAFAGPTRADSPSAPASRLKRTPPPENASPAIVLGKQMFDTNQAAEYLRRAPQTLAKLRCIGGGPAYYKIGRNIYYERVDLDAWLASRKRKSTSDIGS